MKSHPFKKARLIFSALVFSCFILSGTAKAAPNSRFAGTWKGQIDPGTGDLPGGLVTYMMFPEKKWLYVDVRYSKTGKIAMTLQVELQNDPVSGNTLRAGGIELTVAPNSRSGHFKLTQTLFRAGATGTRKLGEGTLRRVSSK